MSHTTVAQIIINHLSPHTGTFDPETRRRLFWTDRRLLEMHQARVLTGLDTSDFDAEIARRMLDRPKEWRWLWDDEDAQPTALSGWEECSWWDRRQTLLMMPRARPRTPSITRWDWHGTS